MSRKARKPTISELRDAIEHVEEAHNRLVSLCMAMNQMVEQQSTILHITLLELGLASVEACSSCGAEVIYPSGLSEHIKSFPVCPNSNDSEDCLHGFSHVEMPDELKEDAPTLYDFDEEE